MSIKPENSIIESPCIRRCCLDDQDVCLGCFRTMQEICAWSEAGGDERQSVLQKAEVRKKQHGQRWGE